jgi:hypothetical protein
MVFGSNAARAPSPTEPPIEARQRHEPVTQFLSIDALLARRETLPPGAAVSADVAAATQPAKVISKSARSEEVHDPGPSRARRILLALALTVAAAAATAALIAALLARTGEAVRSAAGPVAQAGALNTTAASASSPTPAQVEDSHATLPPKAPPRALAGEGPAPRPNGSRTPQRSASDALVAGEFDTALELYRELALSNPGNVAYEKAAQILERRVSAGRARSEIEP